MPSKDIFSIKPPTSQEKIIFLKILTKLAGLDNRVDECEKKFITDTAVMLGISTADINDISADISEDEIVSLAKKITNRHLAMLILREAFLIANADDDLSDKEIAFIGKVGEAMGITPEKTEQISQWVLDYLILQEQSKIVFEQP